MLKLVDVCYSVEDNGKTIEIVKDINLTFDEGKFYVVTGPNGSGKSSIAKLIMGIYKPTSGRIYFNDQDVTNMTVDERARLGMGYAFQHPPVFKGITVKQLLDMSAEKAGKKINPCDIMVNVGLCSQDYLNREINSSLSGGELKRIEIGTVLARDFKVSVFDEPEAGIDLWSFQQLANTFKIMHEKYNSTLVVISHQERILNLADEVVLVKEGRVAEVTSKEKILEDLARDSDCKYRSFCEKGVYNDAECIGQETA